jgi:hypothetical protein
MKQYTLNFCESMEDMLEILQDEIKVHGEDGPVHALPPFQGDSYDAAGPILSGEYGHEEFFRMMMQLRGVLAYNDAPPIIHAAVKVLATLQEAVSRDPEARKGKLARVLNLSRMPDKWLNAWQLPIIVRSFMAQGQSLEAACQEVEERTVWSESTVQKAYM